MFLKLSGIRRTCWKLQQYSRAAGCCFAETFLYFFFFQLLCHITFCVPYPVERVKVLCLVSASRGALPGNFLIPVQNKHRIRSQGGRIKGPKCFVLGGQFGSLDVQAQNKNPPPPPSLQAAKMGETSGFLYCLTPRSSLCCCDGAASPQPSFAGPGTALPVV